MNTKVEDVTYRKLSKVISRVDVRLVGNIFGVEQEVESSIFNILLFYIFQGHKFKEQEEQITDENVDLIFETLVLELGLEFDDEHLVKYKDLIFTDMSLYLFQDYFLFNRPGIEMMYLMKSYPKGIENISNVIKSMNLLEEDKMHHLILFLINTIPEFYFYLVSNEEKILINCLFYSCCKKREYLLEYLNVNFNNTFQFNLLDNEIKFSEDEWKRGWWITDLGIHTYENVFVISSNLVIQQHSMIEAFLLNILKKS